ncbi:XRE family transcriptional regulator [Fodinibius halophilus]|uniref:ImmA/IrrE family metallo-endopeptidase n=1 Tax=Fodinibius halophilus TaxID=1736908 RepID=A0A6M1T6A6_9BACT|nr:XRE family transcriptional regulator [Fodinibius halophilus]NGP87551.1 ImmA/IrrE family metallo-endopeptidase [Fodinibius halophilus]
MPSSRVNINPEVLSFARERSGYVIPEIAKKLQVNEERWLKWEEGEIKPTAKQLIKIASKLDRSPAFFYLNNPPEEEPALSEFRTINNIPLENASPKLIQAIREAKRNRKTLLELYQLQNEEPESIPSYTNISNRIERVAKEVRNWLGVTFEKQNSWRGSSNALTEWKNILENKDIYVIQYPRVDIDEARGFALAESEIPIIGINSQDSYNGRIFTLIHELCHILLKDSVLVNDDLQNYFSSGNQEMERLSNKLTAEILVPSEIIQELFNSQNNELREVNRLRSKFKVSSYVILIRLKNLSLISTQEFNRIKPEVSFSDTSRSGSSGGNAYYNQIARKGKLLVRTAFDAYFNDNISLPELTEITSWKVPNLNELAAKTFDWPEEGKYI